MSTSPDIRLANLLGALATGLSDRMRSAAGTVSGLDETSMTALVALLDFLPHGSVQALSLVCGLSHSGCVRLVNRLSQAGFVERRDGANARSITVILTAAGRELAHQLRAAREATVLSTTISLTEQQTHELTQACEVILGTITTDKLRARRSAGPSIGGALCRLCDFGACGRPQGRCPVATTTGAVQARDSEETGQQHLDPPAL